MRKIHCLLGLLFVALCVGDVASARDAAAPESQARPFIVGACTHFSQGKGILDLNLDRIKRAGIASIRDEVGWGAVEREKGRLAMPEQFDTYVRQAAAQGVNTLLILDYGNRFYDDGDRPRSPEALEGFCRYAEFVVRHFGQQVRLYEIWNEWDISIGMPQKYRKGGSAEDYVKLLKAVYPRIKATEPGATVMAGACTSGGVKKGWLEDIVKLGALDACDAISIHSYNYSDKFPQRGPEACSAWMTGVQEMLRKYKGCDVPFYVTEMGWPTHVGRNGTDPELCGSYLARLYLLARMSPSFKGLWWYDFQDDGWKAEYNEDNFGLVRPDLTPKPAYDVLKDIAPVVTQGRFGDRLPTKDENLWVLRFTGGGQGDTWALWSADDRERQVILQADFPKRPLMIRQTGREMHLTLWGFRDWTSRGGELARNRLSVVVGPRPCLIGNDLTGVSVVEVVPRPRS